MSSTSIRAAVKTRLVELMSDAVGDVQVTYGWPGKDLKTECIYVGKTTGPVTVADMRGGRKTRDDTFTIEVHFLAGKPGQTARAADERVLELYGVFEDVLAANGNLGGFPGVLWAAQLGDDFETADPAPTTEGYLGIATAHAHIKTRLT